MSSTGCRNVGCPPSSRPECCSASLRINTLSASSAAPSFCAMTFSTPSATCFCAASPPPFCACTIPRRKASLRRGRPRARPARRGTRFQDAPLDSIHVSKFTQSELPFDGSDLSLLPGFILKNLASKAICCITFAFTSTVVCGTYKGRQQNNTVPETQTSGQHSLISNTLNREC